MDIGRAVKSLRELKRSSADYIEHQMIVSKKNSETKYGQITITKKDYRRAIKLFKDYLNIKFDLITFRGIFINSHFLDEPKYNLLRLSCATFFTKLQPGDVIYLQTLDQAQFPLPATIKITEEKPLKKKLEDIIKCIIE